MSRSSAGVFAELGDSPTIVVRERPETADDPTCPKCRYAGDYESDWKVVAWVSPDMAAQSNLRDENGNRLGEILMVRCKRCGYRWREEVDKPEAVPSAN